MSLVRSALPTALRDRTGDWTSDDLERLFAHLAHAGHAALDRLSADRLLDVWSDTVRQFQRGSRSEQESLRAGLAESCGLSAAALDAALEVVLEGVAEPHAKRLLTSAKRAEVDGVAWVVLAGNIPGLAVQALLPALAVGRPVLIKSSSAEPHFAPAFVTALGEREPGLRDAVAALAWRGGDSNLDAAAARHATRMVAFGGAEAIAELGAHAAASETRFVAYGPKLSVALVDAGVDPEAIAPGLAEDVARFDQRGCLSVQVVFTAGDAHALAKAVGEALRETAERWPAGALDPATAVQIHRLRTTTALAGGEVLDLPLRTGTVVVQSPDAAGPGPGGRTVRIHPVDTLRDALGALAPWRGHLQGAALAGPGAWALADALTDLGVSRTAPPGALQRAEASWANGGLDPTAPFL